MTGGKRKETPLPAKTSQHGTGRASPNPAADRLRDTVSRLERFARTPMKDDREKSSHPSHKEQAKSKVLQSDGEEDREGSLMVNSPQADRPLTPVRITHLPTLADILTAVNTCNASISSLTQNVDALKIDMQLIRQDMQTVRERTRVVEGRVGILEDTITPLQKFTKSLESKLLQQEAKLEDLEIRMRRSNLRIVGLPERAEGSKPMVFIEDWLRDTFGEKNLSPKFAVERSHRVPFRPLPPGAPPRPFLLKLLNYRDRDAILGMAKYSISIP